MNRYVAIGLGALATVAGVSVWHGPLGTADRFAYPIERQARTALDHWEMPLIQARLERQPMSRRLVLSGPADDFQREELVRRLRALRGVSDVVWDPASLSAEAVR